MKPISTKVHGILDYLSVVLLFLLPRLLNWDNDVTLLLTIVAATVLVYSLVTHYEFSLAKLLPVKGHLALDALGGVLLIGAALLFRDRGTDVLVVLLLMGLFELGAAALTQTKSFSGVVQAGRTQ